MKDKVRRLERAARGELASFELEDGSTFFYDPQVFLQIFDFYLECLRTSAGSWPDPPEPVKMVLKARDVEEAAKQVFGAFLPYDPEIMIRERRLVPRSLVTEYDPEKGVHVALSPHALRPGDLSE